METIGWVMAIFACGDPSTACTRVTVEPAHYVDAAACMAATEKALPLFADRGYPAVEARCRPATEMLAEARTPSPRRG